MLAVSSVLLILRSRETLHKCLQYVLFSRYAYCVETLRKTQCLANLNVTSRLQGNFRRLVVRFPAIPYFVLNESSAFNESSVFNESRVLCS